MNIKIKKIIKKIKEYRMIIFIELTVILLCVSTMCVVYIGHKNVVQERVTNVFNECHKLLKYQHTEKAFIKRAYPIDIVEFFREKIIREDNFLQIVQDGSELGIALELYDKNGNIILSNHSGFSYIEIYGVYTYEVGDDEESVSECLMLSQFFTDEQIHELIDIYDKYENPILKKIIGYYENERFILTRIVMCDESNDEICEIINEDAEKNVEREGIQCVERYSDYYSSDYLEETELGENQTVEWMWIEEVKCLGSSADEANRLFYDVFGNDLGKKFWNDEESSYYFRQEDDSIIGTFELDNDEPQISGNGNVAYGAYAIYADVNYLTWKSTTVRRDMMIIFILFQGFGVALLILFHKYEKKHKELQNMKNTFINAMAHEMKTPAAVIMNTSECILEEINPEKRERYQKIVFQEAEHMSKLINSMLIYTRVNDSEYKLKKESIVLNEITDEILEHFRTLIENKNIHLIRKDSGIFQMKGDRQLMEMVMDNYISNAVKHCTFGGNMIISISPEKLKVYNDGELISHSAIGKIWEPMFQEDESRGKKSDSAGMGLAISASIMKLHGLGYNVGNEEKGVEFLIYKK